MQLPDLVPFLIYFSLELRAIELNLLDCLGNLYILLSDTWLQLNQRVFFLLILLGQVKSEFLHVDNLDLCLLNQVIRLLGILHQWLYPLLIFNKLLLGAL